MRNHISARRIYHQSGPCRDYHHSRLRTEVAAASPFIPHPRKPTPSPPCHPVAASLRSSSSSSSSSSSGLQINSSPPRRPLTSSHRANRRDDRAVRMHSQSTSQSPEVPIQQVPSTSTRIRRRQQQRSARQAAAEEEQRRRLLWTAPQAGRTNSSARQARRRSRSGSGCPRTGTRSAGGRWRTPMRSSTTLEVSR